MSKKLKKIDIMKVNKNNFIDFMTQATPEELNELILKRGKRKLYEPFYVFKDNTSKEETSNGNNCESDCQHQGQSGTG